MLRGPKRLLRSLRLSLRDIRKNCSRATARQRSVCGRRVGSVLRVLGTYRRVRRKRRNRGRSYRRGIVPACIDAIGVASPVRDPGRNRTLPIRLFRFRVLRAMRTLPRNAGNKHKNSQSLWPDAGRGGLSRASCRAPLIHFMKLICYFLLNLEKKPPLGCCANNSASSARLLAVARCTSFRSS